MIEKPTNLDYILAVTPIPFLGEEAAKKVAIFETMKESTLHPELPNFVEIYTQATMVSYRAYAYVLGLTCLGVGKITSLVLDKYFESFFQ